jgi:hypothetical protein
LLVTPSIRAISTACRSPTCFNELQLPAETVAQQLGHTDRGALVRQLYGHPDADLQRRRIREDSPGAARKRRGARAEPPDDES